MAFSESLRLTLRRRAHFSCCLCKALGVEIHHLVPQAEGGPDTEDNAAPLCPSCHETYGGNPEKRKFIREARDLWYEICQRRYAPDSDRLEAIADQLQKAATKEDLEKTLGPIVEYLKSTISAKDATPRQQATKLSQTVGNIGFAFGGISTNKYCKKCNSYSGLVIGDRGVCPTCGTPW